MIRRKINVVFFGVVFSFFFSLCLLRNGAYAVYKFADYNDCINAAKSQFGDNAEKVESIKAACDIATESGRWGLECAMWIGGSSDTATPVISYRTDQSKAIGNVSGACWVASTKYTNYQGPLNAVYATGNTNPLRSGCVKKSGTIRLQNGINTYPACPLDMASEISISTTHISRGYIPSSVTMDSITYDGVEWRTALWTSNSESGTFSIDLSKISYGDLSYYVWRCPAKQNSSGEWTENGDCGTQESALKLILEEKVPVSSSTKIKVDGHVYNNDDSIALDSDVTSKKVYFYNTLEAKSKDKKSYKSHAYYYSATSTINGKSVKSKREKDGKTYSITKKLSDADAGGNAYKSLTDYVEVTGMEPGKSYKVCQNVGYAPEYVVLRNNRYYSLTGSDSSGPFCVTLKVKDIVIVNGKATINGTTSVKDVSGAEKNNSDGKYYANSNSVTVQFNNTLTRTDDVSGSKKKVSPTIVKTKLNSSLNSTISNLEPGKSGSAVTSKTVYLADHRESHSATVCENITKFQSKTYALKWIDGVEQNIGNGNGTGTSSEVCVEIVWPTVEYDIDTTSNVYLFKTSSRDSRSDGDLIQFGGGSSGRVRVQFEHGVKLPSNSGVANGKTISTKLGLSGNIVTYGSATDKPYGVKADLQNNYEKSLTIGNSEQNPVFVGFMSLNATRSEFQDIVGVCGYEHGSSNLDTCDKFIKLGEKVTLSQTINAAPKTFNIDANGVYGSSSSISSTISVDVGHPYNFDLHPHMMSSSGNAVGRGENVEVKTSIDIFANNNDLSRTYTPKDTKITLQYQGYNNVRSELTSGGWNTAQTNTVSNTIGSVTYGFIGNNNGSSNGIKQNDSDTTFNFTIPENFDMRHICFRVGVNYVDSKDHEYPINNAEYVTWSGRWRYSDDADNGGSFNYMCMDVKKRSSFQMWGGNVYAQGTINAAGIVKNNSNEIFGSWTDYGLVAGGNVGSVASGAGLIKGVNNDNASAFCRMMIANTLSPCNSSSGGGNSGIGRTGIGEKILSMTKDDLESAFGNDVTIVKQSSGNINISSNVENKTVYVVGGNITIKNNVEYINGWLVAGGHISTGHNTDTDTTCMPNGDNCDKQLIINGAVFANKLELQRNGGDPRNGLNDTAYAEKIIFNPNDYIKIYRNVRAESAEKGNFVKVYEKELPPRY